MMGLYIIHSLSCLLKKTLIALNQLKFYWLFCIDFPPSTGASFFQLLKGLLSLLRMGYVLLKWSPISPFCGLPSFQSLSESCLVHHLPLRGGPGHFPWLNPWTAFVCNEASALEGRAESQERLPILDRPHACRGQKTWTQGHLWQSTMAFSVILSP